MKVISGIYKGRKIIGYDMEGTRPTMERVKESLFAIIQDHLSESVVLDLFSGSGNLGIEALSQGASYAYLVDYNKKAVKTINENLQSMNITNGEVINADYSKALKILSEKKIKLDLVFLDPPYQTDYIEKSIELIEKYQLLEADGLIICESSSLDKIVYPSTYKCIKDKKYGDKWVAILTRI